MARNKGIIYLPSRVLRDLLDIHVNGHPVDIVGMFHSFDMDAIGLVIYDPVFPITPDGSLIPQYRYDSKLGTRIDLSVAVESDTPPSAAE